MAQYIQKEPLVAEIEKLESRFQNGYDEEYADGYHYSLELVKRILDILEVKEVDLEHLGQEVEDFCYKFDDRKDKWYEMTPHDKHIMVNPTLANFAMCLAKHFFELGLAVSNKVQKGE